MPAHVTDRGIRVLHITSGDVWGGAEEQMRTLVRELAGLGDIAVRVLLFNHGHAETRFREIGVDVTVVDEQVSRAPGLVRGIVRVLHEWRPDIVHTHGYKECVLGTLASRFASRVPCVRTVHGSPESVPRAWQFRKRLVRWADDMTLRRQRRVIAVSGELGGRLSRRLGAHRVAVIDNGIDAGQVERASRGPGVVQARPGEVQIGIVGRLMPVKRIDIFLRVCQLLDHTHGRRVRGWVLGDGPLAGSLRREADSLGIASQVEMPGFVTDVPGSLASLDALLITSDHEGLPMVLLEAMAAGIPVVAHAVGGIPEVLEQGACGTLVYDQDPRRYAEAVTAILEHPAETEGRVRRAQTRVREEYSAHSSALHYRSLYREIVTDPGRGRTTHRWSQSG